MANKAVSVARGRMAFSEDFNLAILPESSEHVLPDPPLDGIGEIVTRTIQSELASGYLKIMVTDAVKDEVVIPLNLNAGISFFSQTVNADGSPFTEQVLYVAEEEFEGQVYHVAYVTLSTKSGEAFGFSPGHVVEFTPHWSPVITDPPLPYEGNYLWSLRFELVPTAV